VAISLFWWDIEGGLLDLYSLPIIFTIGRGGESGFDNQCWIASLAFNNRLNPQLAGKACHARHHPPYRPPFIPPILLRKIEGKRTEGRIYSLSVFAR